VGETRKIYTVDIHELAMEAVKKKSEKYGLGNVEPLLISGQASTIPDHIADVVCAMELIAECRSSTNMRLAVISNCGFPEAQHNNVAIAICRRFALASGLEWAGGLALGDGWGRLWQEAEGSGRDGPQHHQVARSHCGRARER